MRVVNKYNIYIYIYISLSLSYTNFYEVPGRVLKNFKNEVCRLQFHGTALKVSHGWQNIAQGRCQLCATGYRAALNFVTL